MTRAVAQQSLRDALNRLRREGEGWLSEVMPTGGTSQAANHPHGGKFYSGPRRQCAPDSQELDTEDAAAAADPHGAILGYHDSNLDVGIIFTKVLGVTEDENRRYSDAYTHLEKMLEGDLFLHSSDECDRLCDVLTDIMRDLQSGEVSLSNWDAMDQHKRKLRSTLISFTNSLQIHEERTVKRAKKTFRAAR